SENHDKEFYQEIGEKGGEARSRQNSNDNNSNSNNNNSR
ncbi:KGG domain-containing protein, partial [Rossellomorea vietnamensis]